MNISLYTASIPVFKQMLTSMSAVLFGSAPVHRLHARVVERRDEGVVVG